MSTSKPEKQALLPGLAGEQLLSRCSCSSLRNKVLLLVLTGNSCYLSSYIGVGMTVGIHGMEIQHSRSMFCGLSAALVTPWSSNGHCRGRNGY